YFRRHFVCYASRYFADNIYSRFFQTAFEKQGVSVKYSGLNLNQYSVASP
ncbi:hypothetical protein I7R75_10565, partial [Neisseria meningitidis]|nr:hypothetical protein [Neisseria meningitidis]